MATRETLIQIYDRLFERYGPQHWWPGETPFEIVVGAILTQNTNWTNVEKAIANLKAADVLEPEALTRLEVESLAELIRPAGYFRVKARRLASFLSCLRDEFGGRLENLARGDTDALRETLLAVNGIGPETADSILLYACHKPVFVVDAYTARIAVRHHLIEPPFGYDELQDLFQSNLPRDVQVYNEYHALIVRTGKEFCKPKARCEGCPLEALPHSVEGG